MALGEETWRREASWTAAFNDIKTFHDQAYRKIDEALKFDEEGHRDKALRSYDEGLMLLDKALAVNIECPSNPDFTWEKACSMVDKMRKTRKEILSRIADTQVQPPRDLGPPVLGPPVLVTPRPEELTLEPPPSYEEAMATSPSSSTVSNIPSLPQSTPTPPVPLTYSELGDALRNLKVETNTQSVQVIFSVDNVRMYFISPDGRVSAPSQPNLLRVLQLEDGQRELPQFFLQVGDWFYPLVPDVSPCFRSDYGAFILPDLQSNVEGSAVGLILPAEADISLYNLLEDMLGGGVMSSPPAAPPRSKRDFSTTISRGLVTGAHYVSTGLVKGAEAASSLMSSTTPKIMSRIQPEATPRPVPPTLRTGAKVARTVTHTAVNVTGYVGTEDQYTKSTYEKLTKLSEDLKKKLAENPSHWRTRRRHKHGRRREHGHEREDDSEEQHGRKHGHRRKHRRDKRDSESDGESHGRRRKRKIWWKKKRNSTGGGKSLLSWISNGNGLISENNFGFLEHYSLIWLHGWIFNWCQLLSGTHVVCSL